MATAQDLPLHRAPPDLAFSDALSPHPNSSAVSWAAVFAGAAAAAALGLILLILGTGLGMTAVSPWANDGMSATAFGVTTIVWLTLSQLLSSGMGGYLAGRLRTRWPDAPRDEVYFRDTAHGFLSWAVATLVTAAVLTSAVSAIVGAGVKAGASVVSGAASSAAMAAGGVLADRGDEAGTGTGLGNGPIDYFVDTLFREPNEAPTGSTATRPATSTPTGTTTTPPGTTPSTPDSATDTTAASTSAAAAATDTPPPSASATRSPRALPPGRSAAQDSAEVARIFMNADLSQPLPAEDQRYVAQIVAQRTGLTQQEAEQRVSQNYTQMQTRLQEAETQARAAADDARKATAYSALWLFVSLLIGAFVASLAATFGGRQRDA